MPRAKSTTSKPTPPPAPTPSDAPAADTPAAGAAANADAPRPPVDKPAKGKLSIKARDDEPTRREVFDVEYPVKGETVVDRGFLTRDAAEAHADMVREAYGL